MEPPQYAHLANGELLEGLEGDRYATLRNGELLELATLEADSYRREALSPEVALWVHAPAGA